MLLTVGWPQSDVTDWLLSLDTLADFRGSSSAGGNGVGPGGGGAGGGEWLLARRSTRLLSGHLLPFSLRYFPRARSSRVGGDRGFGASSSDLADGDVLRLGLAALAFAPAGPDHAGVDRLPLTSAAVLALATAGLGLARGDFDFLAAGRSLALSPAGSALGKIERELCDRDRCGGCLGCCCC